MTRTVEETAQLLGRSHEHRFDRLMPGYHERINRREAVLKEEVLAGSFSALLLKLAAAMLAIAIAIYGLAQFYGSVVAKGGHATDTSMQQITIANDILRVPANMIRFRSQRNAAALQRLDLYAHWPSMTGYSEEKAAIFDDLEADAPVLFLSIEPRDMTTDMSGRVATIYETFFAGPATEAGNGLVRRAFASDSAYFMEDLYYEAGSPYPFAARCIRETDRVAESICIRDIHVGKDLMVTYRFHTSLLADWRRFDPAIRELVSGFVVN